MFKPLDEMTQGEALDRWERILRLVCENSKRDALAFRASRERTKQLKAYVDAITANDRAKTAVEEHPEDLKAKEILAQATEVLNQARETLRNSLRH